VGISAPPVGIAPNGKPNAVPRSHGFHERPRSSRPSHCEPVTSACSSSRPPRRTRDAMCRASPIANSPTATITMSTPANSWSTPKVSRAWPVSWSIPISPIASPSPSESRPRITERPISAVTATNASTTSAK